MTKFSVGINQKFDKAEDIEEKLADLKSGVTEVNFGGNSYGIGACDAIAKKLAQVDTLEVANLDDMFTGRLRAEIPESMDLLLTALLNCKKCHTVNLSDNAFGIATVAPLEKFLSKHTPLKHLILTNNGFGPEAGARVGKALEELAEKKRAEGSDAKLETVVCGRNRLENGSMEAWAAFLKAHGSIKHLEMYQNGIRQEGVEQLMLGGLKHSPELQKLNLEDNTFTGRGTDAMVEVLESWPGIVEITINDCLLGNEGGLKFSEKVRNAKNLGNLETLRLQYNEIDHNGLEHIKNAVSDNLKALKQLDLNGNQFKEDHEHIDSINATFSEKGFGELDELDDMDIDSDEEDEDESDEDESDEDESKKLADKLSKTNI